MTTLVVPRPNASSLWVKAVDELPDELKHGIDFNNSEKIDILKDLREKAEKSRNQFLASRWKYTRKSGETVIMRDLFEKFVRWVDMFKQIGDVAVQYDPAHASLPWAGIRLILQIAVNDTKKLESVMEDLTWISELICRYAIVETLYIYDTSTAHKELENAVIRLYAKILSHLSYITKYFGQGTTKRLIKSTGSSHTFDSSLDDIRKSEQRVEEWRSLADSNDNVKKNSNLTDLLNDMNQPLKRIDQSLEKVTDNLDRSKRLDILKWLSPEPYLGHHKQVKEDLLKDTGEWLLNDPLFKKWKDDSASSILWLHGIAGSGKSKLVSVVIDDAMNNFQARNSPQPVFFYCSRNPAEPTRSNPRAILASVARQLSAIAPGKPLLKPTIGMYEDEEDQGFATGPPGIKDTCELILRLIELYPQTTIIIDAIDECDPQKRGELLEFLETTLQNASSLVKVFVSSRNDQDIVYKLKNYPNLHINSQSNREDIARFVEYEVDRLIQQKKLLRHSQSPDQLKKLIVSETVKGAHEMFRWASMQLQHLSLLTLDDDIKNAVGRLPPDLRTLYNELYNLLSATPGELRAIIFKNALHWLLSAQTRLEPKEFLTAVTLIPNTDQRVPITKEQLLEICNNFIVYDSQVHTFRFAHLSVREFLEGRPEFSVPSSNCLIAETCLWTLLCTNPTAANQKFLYGLNWKIKVELPVILELKGYADLFWGQHCRLAGPLRKSGSLQAVLEYLFLKEYDIRPILFSNEKNQHSGVLHEQNQRPESIITLWINRVDRVSGGRRYYDRSFDRGQLAGTFNEIRFRDIQRGSEPFVSRQIRSCRPIATSLASTGLFVICVYDLEELGKELLVDEALTRPFINLDGQKVYNVAAIHQSCGVISHFLAKKEFGAAFAKDMLRYASSGYHQDMMKLANNEYGRDMMRLASNRYDEDMIKLASNGYDQVTEILASDAYDHDVAKALIEHWKADTQSREVVLMTAMETCSKEIVEEFLDAWEDVPITQEMVEIATGNPYHVSELITLLRQRKAEFQVTQNMITNAVISNSVEAVELLFSHGKVRAKVTQATIAYGLFGSVELVEFLLKECEEEAKATQGMVIDGITQSKSDLPMIRFLLVPDKMDIRVTQQMIETAAGVSSTPVELANALLNRRTEDFIITKETVKAIAGKDQRNELMILFLSKRRRDLPIATPVMTTIFRCFDVEVLEVLLDECGIETVVTVENINAFVERDIIEEIHQ